MIKPSFLHLQWLDNLQFKCSYDILLESSLYEHLIIFTCKTNSSATIKGYFYIQNHYLSHNMNIHYGLQCFNLKFVRSFSSTPHLYHVARKNMQHIYDTCNIKIIQSYRLSVSGVVNLSNYPMKQTKIKINLLIKKKERPKSAHHTHAYYCSFKYIC